MKGMAKLLRNGAKMLSKSCPECATPLFQLKSGEIICANCQRRVVIVPEGEEKIAEAGVQLESIENILIVKLVSLSKVISEESDIKTLLRLSELMDSLLDNLQKLRTSRNL
jgi:UPF0148 protein